MYNFLGSFKTSDYILLRDFAQAELANIELRLANLALERSRLESLMNKYTKLEYLFFKNSSDPKVDSFYKNIPQEMTDMVQGKVNIFNMEPAYYVNLLKEWITPTIKTKRENPQYMLLKMKDQMEYINQEQFTLRMRQIDYTSLIEKITQLINTNLHLSETTTESDEL